MEGIFLGCVIWEDSPQLKAEDVLSFCSYSAT